jgi:predicted nucleic acid-binding protein
MTVVVADTSPLRYLVMIEEADVFAKLYGRVLIPRTVAIELDQPKTPDTVRRWVQAYPAWLEIVDSFPEASIEADIDTGERDAISLAVARGAELVLMDDREGVEEAQRLGLAVTGTLGVLSRAAERGLLSLPAVFEKLRKTNFRASQTVLEFLLVEDARRSAR